MTGRTHELRRRIARTVAESPTMDEWTARELRRADRRLARLEKAERAEAARDRRVYGDLQPGERAARESMDRRAREGTRTV